MSNTSARTDDSFYTCCSSVFESPKESESDSLLDALNNSVFLVPSSINDLWILEQISKFKSANKEKSRCEDRKEDGCGNDPCETSDSMSNDEQQVPSRLSDVVRNKLYTNKLFEEDSLIIEELVKQLSLDSVDEEHASSSDMVLTQCEIDEIKDIISQDY